MIQVQNGSGCALHQHLSLTAPPVERVKPYLIFKRPSQSAELDLDSGTAAQVPILKLASNQGR